MSESLFDTAARYQPLLWAALQFAQSKAASIEM
jgi:hypothetical protein